MSSPSVCADALVLRTVPYGESDLVVHLLVWGQGRVGAFARGARKSSRRFGVALEPLSRLRVEYLERRSSELVDLRSASLVTAFPGLRADLAALAHAGYATELVRELVKEREPNDRIFRLLVDFFSLLETRGAKSLVLRAFELQVLDAVGLSPQLRGCARCGSDPARDPESAFEPRAGGLVCARCARGGTRLGPGGLALLRALSRGLEGAAEADETGLPLDPVRLALRGFIEEQLPKPLRSLSFLESVGAPP